MLLHLSIFLSQLHRVIDKKNIYEKKEAAFTSFSGEIKWSEVVRIIAFDGTISSCHELLSNLIKQHSCRRNSDNLTALTIHALSHSQILQFMSSVPLHFP